MIPTLYRRGWGALQRYDPRVKLLNTATLVVIFFLPLRLLHLAAYLAAAALLVALLLGLRDLWQPFRAIGPILILVLLLTPPFHRGGPVLVAVRGFALVTTSGLLEALRLIIRFSGISLAFFAFVRSTEPEGLVRALRWFGLPFGAALVVSIAFQFIPSIKSLYDQVQDAHRLRQAAGEADGERRGFRRRLAAVIPALTSVLILSVRRIMVLAMVLELRGVGRRGRRSSYAALPGGAVLLRHGLVGAGVEAALLLAAVLFA